MLSARFPSMLAVVGGFFPIFMANAALDFKAELSKMFSFVSFKVLLKINQLEFL